MFGVEEVKYAASALNVTKGSGAVVVAVLDTGIDYTHQDLSPNMFRNTADCNANGIDEDRNGHPDDCYGIDTLNNDSDPMDDHGHGTHVAGTIGAVGNNGLGVVGVSPHVQLMACKFMNQDGLGSIAGAIAVQRQERDACQAGATSDAIFAVESIRPLLVSRVSD